MVEFLQKFPDPDSVPITTEIQSTGVQIMSNRSTTFHKDLISSF